MINPLKIHLHIFQLEGYSPKRFLSWWVSHPFTYKVSQKLPLVMTPKAIQLLFLSYFQVLILLFLSGSNPSILPVFIVLLLCPFPLLFISLLLMKPYEMINRQKTIQACRQTVLSHPHLTTIGITGSFGKTSTKDFLYEILDAHKSTLRTPASYNTVFGIAKVVRLELTKNIHYFLCEMGAYVRGEIKELVYQVPPDYAILTSIGTQHLERFKTIENTTLAKFELLDAVKPQNALANLDNPFIKNHLKKPKYQGVKTYSLHDPKADFFVKTYSLSAKGMKLTLIYKGKSSQFSSSLFGFSNLQNLVAAIGMALILKVPYETIKKAVSELTPSPHRLELKTINKAILIDNAYSSNEAGLIQLLADLNYIPGKKVLITPGIVELGFKTREVHQRLGQLASPIFEEVYLEGHSARTDSFCEGLMESSTPPKVTFLETPEQLWPTINHLAKTYDWILLENDLPDNY